MTPAARPAARAAGGPARAVAERLAEPAVFQSLVLLLASVAAALALRWPAAGAPNESWYVVAPVRAVVAALIALGFGAAEGRRASLPTLGALLAMAWLAAPFEVAAHAASAPAAHVAWPLAVAPLEMIVHYGAGATLATLLRPLRLGALLPLAAPALLVGAGLLDARLGRNLLGPVPGATLPSRARIAFLAGASVLVLVVLAVRAARDARRARRAAGAAPHPAAPPSREVP